MPSADALFDEAFAALPDLYGLDKKVTPHSSRDLYKRAAGEVEARSVSDRAWLSADERRTRHPWQQDTPAEDQVMIFLDEITSELRAILAP